MDAGGRPWSNGTMIKTNNLLLAHQAESIRNEAYASKVESGPYHARYVEYGTPTIEAATTNRAFCRACGCKITKGTKVIRFAWDIGGCGSWTTADSRIHYDGCDCDRAKAAKAAAEKPAPWITPQQVKAIAAIDRWITPRYLKDGKEYKAGYVEQMDHRTVMYYFTIGSTTDEGTMAAVLCRDTWQLFISPGGQIRAYCDSRSTSYKGTVTKTGIHALIWGRRS